MAVRLVPVMPSEPSIFPRIRLVGIRRRRPVPRPPAPAPTQTDWPATFTAITAEHHARVKAMFPPGTFDECP